MNNEILARAKAVRLLILDVDGVVTDGRVWVGPEGQEWLAFDRRDGEGISRVRQCGVEVAFVTRESLPTPAEWRAKKLSVRLFLGVKDKANSLEAIVREYSVGRLRPLALAEVAYMGDDEPDVGAMGMVGFAVAPADAHLAARQAAHWITRAKGGRGAVREVCDLLISARTGHDSG